MSLAILVAAIPLIAVVPVLLLRHRPRYPLLVASVACLLAVAAIYLGSGANAAVSIDSGRNTGLFGRPFEITDWNRGALQTLFVAAAIVFALAFRGESGWPFLPLGLSTLGVLSAAMMIRPLALSALLLAAGAALLAIMIQAEHTGDRSTLGASRFLALNLFALPFMLAAGYYVQQAANSADQATIDASREFAGYALHFGLILLLGALPLYSWTHAVARDAPVPVGAFIASVYTGTALMMVLGVRHDQPWLAATQGAGILRTMGVITLVFGALLGCAQKSFGRVIACALLTDAGVNALLVQANTPDAHSTIALSVLARAASIGVLGLGMAILRLSRDTDSFDRLRGAFHTGPAAQMAVAALSVGGLSLAGLPGTLGFLQTWLRMRTMAALDVEIAALFVVACVSVACGFLRGVAAMLSPAAVPGIAVPARMRRGEVAVVGLACASLVLLGVWPEPLTQLASAVATGLASP